MLKRFFLTILILTPFISSAQSVDMAERKEIMDNSRKFNEFLYYLTSGYLEKMSSTKVTEDAIKAVLEKLDPHSSYITKEEMKEISESFDGNFEGIGIEFNVLKDTIIVVNPIKGGPSEMVGLKSGDRIVKVDDKPVIGTTQTGVPKILRGPKGTHIKLEVVRHSEKEPLIFNIIRDKIPMYSVDAAYMLNDTTAYVKVNRFMTTTTEEFIKAMASMPNAKALILDLRGNSGGFLEQAIMLSDQFFDEGKLIVYTEGRAFPRRDEMSTAEGVFKTGRVVVLVDEESASASEIVAGAIQDHDRGVIIGRQTFGKGLVQQQIPLNDSSAIRLTIARYYTPSGRAIQRPYKMGDAKGYYTDYYKRYTSGELINHDSLKLVMPDSLKSQTLRLGRTVYGGGGINPDIFVGIDTSGYSKYWSALIRSGIISDYVVDVVDKERKDLLRKYKTFEDFNTKYEISDDFIKGLMKAGETKGVSQEANDLSKAETNIKLQLKALVAQKLWDFNEFYKVMSRDDKTIEKSLDVLNNTESKYLHN